MPVHRRVFDRRVLYPGDTLIRENEYGDSAYYIQNGQFGVYKHIGGEEILLTVLPGNSIVGEMALIDDGRRSATVRCLETATVVVVNREAFERKLGRLDPFVKALLEMFSQKIRRLNEDYCDVERKLQWLLRQIGLPPRQPSSRWVRAQQQAPVQQTPVDGRPQSVKPAPAAEPQTAHDLLADGDPRARDALSELTRESIDRYDRLKLELAMLYHPDCTGGRANETMARADVFREIWAVLQKIDEEYRTLT